MQKLTLQGTPREMGRQHGEALRKEIHELSEIRNHLLFGFLEGLDQAAVEELALAHLEPLKSVPHLYEEFCGISEGASIAYGDLIVLNNYTDIRDFAPPKGDPGGCSVFSFRSADQIAYGQTWDMHASATPHMVQLSINGQAEILTVSGCVGLAGINPSGLGIFINNVHCRETQVGLIWPVLVRLMLEQKTVDQALATMRAHPPSSGHNYLLCDPQQSINVETTGKRIDVTAKQDSPGAIFHTNHYLGALKETEILSRQSKTTHARYNALKDYFSENHAGKSTDQIFEEILTSSVSIPQPQAPHAPMTCGGLGYDPISKKGFSYRGAFVDDQRLEFQF